MQHSQPYYELIIWARLLLARKQPTEALAVLDVLAPVAGSDRWTTCAIRVLALRGLAHDMQGRRSEAFSQIAQALTLAAPQGHIRVFADEGDALVALLAGGRRMGAWQDPLLAAHVDRVLAAALASPTHAGDHGRLGYDSAPPSPRAPDFGGAGSYANGAAAGGPARLVEPLSRRELEVLRLVADGLGNRAIADRLIVSVGTVKSHIHSIYGKLGAQDRGQAVVQAHELDLL